MLMEKGMFENPSYNLKGSGGLGISEYGMEGMRYLEPTQKLTDASLKRLGYFGKIPTESGGFMTELSSAFELGDKTISFPLIVPTLDINEIKLLQSGEDPTDSIYKKAQEWAMLRIQKGLSPFATPDELRYPLPEASQTNTESQPWYANTLRSLGF
jgi:predicted methyltransferase